MLIEKKLQKEGFKYLMKNRLKLYKECIKLIRKCKDSGRHKSKINYNEVYLIGYNNKIDYGGDEKNCYGDYWIFYIGKISEKNPNILKYSFDLFSLYGYKEDEYNEEIEENEDDEKRYKIFYEDTFFSGNTFITPINISIKTILCKAYHNKVLKLLQNNNNI